MEKVNLYNSNITSYNNAWPRGAAQTLDRSCEQRRLPARDCNCLFLESVTRRFRLVMFIRYSFAAKQCCWISACHFMDEYELLATLTKNFNWIVQYIHFQNRKQLKGDDYNYVNLRTTYNIVVLKTYQEQYI